MPTRDWRGLPPRTQNWNFTIERELSPSTVLKVSYAGSNSHFLPTQVGRGIYSDQLNPEYLPLGALLTSTSHTRQYRCGSGHKSRGSIALRQFRGKRLAKCSSPSLNMSVCKLGR